MNLSSVGNVVFRCPVAKMQSKQGTEKYVIDVDGNGKQDVFARDGLLGLSCSYTKINRYEPELDKGLVEAIASQPGIRTEQDLPGLKVTVPSHRTDGAQLWGDFGGGHSQDKSLDWFTKKVTPVKGAHWGLETDVEGQVWFIATK